MAAVIRKGNCRFLFHPAECVVRLDYCSKETPFELEQINQPGEPVYAHSGKDIQVPVPLFAAECPPFLIYREILVQHKEIVAVIAAAVAMAESESSGLKFRVVSFRRI